jgi:carbonic anhydrase
MTTVDAAAQYVEYEQHGAEWPGQKWDINGDGNKQWSCSGPNQSPIDLSYQVPVVDAKVDNFTKHYENIVPDPRKTTPTKVGWEDASSTVYVRYDHPPDPRSKQWYFKSSYASDYLWGPSTFYGIQFHLHSGSEHTIDGQRFDLEMHTVHLPDKNEQGFMAAALGIIFDTTNYDPSVTDAQRAAIDKFFDSLMLYDHTNPESKEVAYGELIDALDTDNRWVYKGSVTTPPCARLVYWNVLAQVYPVQPKHLLQYKDQLAKRPAAAYAAKYVDYSGNYREINPYNGHDLKLL